LISHCTFKLAALASGTQRANPFPGPFIVVTRPVAGLPKRPSRGLEVEETYAFRRTEGSAAKRNFGITLPRRSASGAEMGGDDIDMRMFAQRVGSSVT
jgi:hypothetical protein